MISEKRKSLEDFILQQMLGPGACAKRYQYLRESDVNEENTYCEIVNTTPGSLYSTGILFPQKEIKINSFNNNNVVDDESEDGIEIDSENSDSEESINEQNNSEIEDTSGSITELEEDDIFSLSQRFPNTIGLSCCLAPEFCNSLKDKLKIFISGRYYKKIEKEERLRILVKIEDRVEEFIKFYESLDADIKLHFGYKDGFLFAKSIFDSKTYSTYIQRIKEVNLNKAKEIASINGGLDELFIKTQKEEHRYLKSYKEKLFQQLSKIKDNSYISEEEIAFIEIQMNRVEMYETFISYFDDVLSIFSTKGFGFWKCEFFSKEISLKDISFEFENGQKKIIYKPCKIESLKDIIEYPVHEKDQASLSCWIQLTKDSRNKENKSTYLKVQLENTSSKFKEESKRYFSIVTEGVNETSFFGVEIKIESNYLIPYRKVEEILDIEDDDKKQEYLYRNVEDYSVGHICSSDWGKTKVGVRYVKTDFMPSCETPDVESEPRDKNNLIINTETGKYIPKPLLVDINCLEFKWLSVFSNITNEQIIDKLHAFVSSYEKWINSLPYSSDDLVAKSNIKDCFNDCTRIEQNLELLNDQNNMLSFRIMNAAMFMQMWNGEYAGSELLNKLMELDSFKKSKFNFDFYKVANDDIFKKGVSASWRPFQLAFILLNLDGIIRQKDDLEWAKRNELVDLVWFPTGGGKTEAYLGIIAFSIIHRRRTFTEVKSNGTVAIMRYTLRLLATQQFQRALRVILALELIRKWDIKDYKLGNEIISIGLYVGGDSLPNKAKNIDINKTEDSLESECLKWIEGKDSKIPLDKNKCPWCGYELKYEEEEYGNKQFGIHFKCKRKCCNFRQYIPAMLCDDYIYQYPPTLLFGTVDKFAQLAYKISNSPKEITKDSRRLFGKGIGIDYYPPELIIQDELHLLLGPLGSAVSLFEAAIDQLCSREENIEGKIIKVRPKIISSTATTRNTPLQIRALYDRSVNIFPKPGVDYDDSFFSFYKRSSSTNNINDSTFISKRKYIGILPTGRTQMTTQLRLSAILFVHRAIFEKENLLVKNDPKFIKAMDYYHSIISYFNSLKEVGKTDAQFYTEFIKYTRRLFKRVLRYSDKLECYYAYETSYTKSELTGRLSGSDVVKELAKVNTTWDYDKRLPHKINNDWVKGFTPPDFIVATNMISVGLDISRFNTIIMNSMPRNIAEYIQASSRVARDSLGLVITLHNPFRSRDLSHFEKFREFHEKMYCYVEPISITPFSNKAIDRYMPLYLATIIRHNYVELANRTSASLLNKVKKTELLNWLMKYFVERYNRTKILNDDLKNLLTEDALLYIKKYLEFSLNEWLQQIPLDLNKNELVYSGALYVNDIKKKIKKEKNLFVALDAYESEDNSKNWRVPMSLRTVEPEAVIRIID